MFEIEFGAVFADSFIPKKSDKIIFPPQMEYFTIQSRNIRFYFCLKCRKLFAKKYKGLLEVWDGYSPKYCFTSTSYIFPSECPFCYAPFWFTLACDRYTSEVSHV